MNFHPSLPFLLLLCFAIQATADDIGTGASILKVPGNYKIVVRRNVEIVPAPPAHKPLAPHQKMTLAAHLQDQFGAKRYHRRSAWAGDSGGYAPIIERPRTWKPIGEVNYITIHHSEGIPLDHPAQMIRLIYRGHTAPNGHLYAADVGYHFFVDRKGQIWEGRDATKMGTHVKSRPEGRNNIGNIGICGLGSFLYEKPTPEMTQAIVDLCYWISRYYDRPLAVRGHQDWVGVNRFDSPGGVDCPGTLQRSVFIARNRITGAFAPSIAGN